MESGNGGRSPAGGAAPPDGGAAAGAGDRLGSSVPPAGTVAGSVRGLPAEAGDAAFGVPVCERI